MLVSMRQTLLCCAVSILCAVPALGQHFPSSDSLTALVKARVGNSGVGMVLGVMEADGTTRIVWHGSAGLDAKPLGPKSVFEIGSITKVFTGILLADLVERGQVSLSDPISRHLPPGTKVPTRNGRQITLLDLATHRSSLTRMPTNIVPEGNNPYPKYTIAQLYAYLAEHQLRRDIGSEYEYSNIAVALLGHLIERVAGAPYEQLVQERILRPLGMSMSSTKVEGPVKEWLTVGHDERGFQAAYRGWHDLPAMGAIRSNALDLLRFVAANTGPPENRLERVMRSSHEVRDSVAPNVDIGLNWQIRKIGNRRIIGHGGATQGFRAYLAFDPDTRVGAVALANYPASLADLVVSLINTGVPLSGVVADRAEIDLPETVLRQYVGDYELRPAFSINVTLENGGLFAQLSGQGKLAIFPESEAKFFYRAVNAQLSFTRDASGAVTGLILHQGGREQPARRRTAPGVSIATAQEIAAALPGRKISIPSKALGGERALRIQTPAGYELSQSSRFPVLLIPETERPLYQAASVAGSLAQRQQAPQMIVVHVAGVPAAAERAAFAKFLSEELVPWVSREYRTVSYNVLAGSTDLLAATSGFQAEIPVGDETALDDGLKRLFDGWALSDLTKLAADTGTAGWATIDAHFARLSERFGFKAVPHEDIADNAAGVLVQQRRFDAAIRVLEKNRELHPGNAEVWNHLGDGYRVLCRWPESKEHYTRAHELARAMAYTNLSSYASELDRITQEIASGKSCTSPTAPRATVTVPAAILAGYVGEYAFSARLSLVVTLENGILYGQITGQGKAPLRAESETRFFMEGIANQFTFTKDGVTLHQGGRDVPGRKVR